ncbi:hypothetical protein GCM10023188_12260 [Pontibacter saemangeumensis]|uniref:Methyltransferase domain-containing protein n=1 Tax=Pontibacter saemangeumensis TaxID=1084525 RepID=A0ABP8LG17_9BACT
MSIFKDYSSYYNLLYKDKAYGDEAEYIIGLILKHNPSAKSILNLGCGTGQHDFIFSEKGFDVTGVDQSEDMLKLAREGANERELEREIAFLNGDLRTLRLNHQYDVVLALFHVMSYQITNEDLHKAFETACLHLKAGGVFIFDCWFGPGVLTDPPKVRLKKFENEQLLIKRTAIPKAHPNENVIDVNFDILIKEKATNQFTEIQEQHRMRYLFKPELDLFFNKTALNLLEYKEWMTDREPDYNSWNACFILNK